MGSSDTTLGGPVRPFPSTMWSQVLGAGERSPEKLNELLRAYWKPVYAYIRASWRKPVEDAKDLTQAFFAHLLEKDTLSRLRPDMGSFRGYLKQALKHFLIDAERAAALRRPATPLFALDEDVEASDESPDRAFDRHWFRCLTSTSLEALKDRLTGDDKAKTFEVFKRYVIDPSYSPEPTPTYRELAAQLGITEKDVDHALRHCSAALLEILRTGIRGYVESERDVDAELRRLLTE
jgi:RNA polymerase sigma factor (sigma-70 family)